jgi:protein-S-isoprenylcysteine O-methyltransferase Ste14/uncharacterized membrane protein (UPF0127 family)
MSGSAAVCRVTLAGSGTLLADRVRAAHTHWTRLKGLLGTRTLEPGAGLWLMPCRQVHMFGMQYPVDVAFLDDDLRVVETVATLLPGKISPKVADATSVLELPAGQLAAHGIANGARLAIEPAPGFTTVPATGLSTAFVNLCLAAVFVFFASAHFAAGLRTGEWLILAPIVLQESMIITLLLTRRRTNAVSTEPAAWVAGILGSFAPLLFRPTDAAGMIAVGAPIQILGLLLSCTALASLGRSFGIVPAHRGIQTSGLYNFIRHPMYTAHLIGYLGYLISYPSLRNAVIGTVTALALNLRAGFEERLLTRDPSYAAYLRRVAWRFLPRLY